MAEIRTVIQVASELLAEVNDALKRRDHKEKEGTTLYSFSAIFPDLEFVADVDVVICRGSVESDSDTPYINAVLFARDDTQVKGLTGFNEVACCEPQFDKLQGEYHWDYNGNHFILTLKEGRNGC